MKDKKEIKKFKIDEDFNKIYKMEQKLKWTGQYEFNYNSDVIEDNNKIIVLDGYDYCDGYRYKLIIF